MTDDTASPAPFSGDRFVIENAATRAEIGAVAAVLCEIRVGGIRITETVPRDTVPPSGCGMVLAPWPNRVRGGRWTLDGAPQQLDITDPGYGGATHGLLRNTAYRVRERTADAITLGALIPPQHGWPFLLDTTVRYSLRAPGDPAGDGLDVTHTAVNLGTAAAPWAVGAHPYFRVGEVPIEELTVAVAGTVRVELDDVKIPVATLPVAGTDHDLRGGRRLSELSVDTAFGEPGAGLRGVPGLAAELRAPDGSRVELHQDADYGWTQVFAPRDFPRPAEHGGPGLAIALEPMTAPADALNSGVDLRWLEPGETRRSSWSVRYRAAAGAVE